eukprot:8601472-Pyramimonas_sp.AAC.1
MALNPRRHIANTSSRMPRRPRPPRPPPRAGPPAGDAIRGKLRGAEWRGVRPRRSACKAARLSQHDYRQTTMAAQLLWDTDT